jgi:uncharacterized protein (TIGR02117 family)
MTARSAVVLFVFLTTWFDGTGCGAADRSVTAPGRTQRISVLVDGYHSGLIVPAREVPEAAWPARRDFPEADYLELGWGEREYYARVDPGAWLGLRALFTPSPSTLRAMPIAGSPARVFANGVSIDLEVSQAGFERMVEFVRETHELDADGRAIGIAHQHQDGSRYYASPRTFHAFENCNVWVARALKAAGLPVRPETAITTDMLLLQIRPLGVATPVSSHRAS